MSNPESNTILSVAVPVYNGEKFLEKCLHSISNSVANLDKVDKDSLEVIVCDNHSTDRTLEIAHSQTLECTYHIIQTPEHYENRTLGWRYALASAQGIWMMMLHADDLMANNGLSEILSACRLQVEGSAVMISGRHRTFTDSSPPSRLRPFWPLKALIKGEPLRQKVLPFICPFVPFTVMRRSTYLQVNGLNKSYELVQDWELWIRLLAFGDLYYHPQEFGLWRTHGFSEKYAKIFAQEHALISLSIQKLIPNLSNHAAKSCLDVQLAKVKNWVPNISLDSLITDIEKITDTKDQPIRRLPTNQESQKLLRWANRNITIQLYWLRLIGLFYFLSSSISSQKS